MSVPQWQKLITANTTYFDAKLHYRENVSATTRKGDEWLNLIFSSRVSVPASGETGVTYQNYKRTDKLQLWFESVFYKAVEQIRFQR